MTEKQEQLPGIQGGRSRPSRRLSAPAVKQEKQSRQQEGEYCEGQHTVAPAPAPLEIGGRTVEIGEHVQIREVGSDDQCGGSQRGSPAQPAAGERGSDQRMADRIYSSLASISS
jgi:hypothetical protein